MKKQLLFYCCVLLFANLAFAQTPRLPTPSVLAHAGVKIIHITKKPIRVEKMAHQNKPITLETVKNNEIIVTKVFKTQIPDRLFTYFINPRGEIDSIYYYPTDTGYHKKDVFVYNDANALVEFKRIAATGEIETRELVDKTPENEWRYRKWHGQDLVAITKSRPDSIVYESIQYHDQLPKQHYTTEIYDFKNDIKTETYYEGEKVIVQKRYQWNSKKGVTKSFTYKEERSAHGNEVEATSERMEYLVNEKGEVVNSDNGTFFDQFGKFNFYERYEIFKGISNGHLSDFTEDSLVAQKEFSEMQDFDGTSIVYLFEILYE